jgi:hypothetical protein
MLRAGEVNAQPHGLAVMGFGTLPFTTRRRIMTKKDYVMIAALFHEARSEGYTLNQTIKLFAEMFDDNNDRFDYERFVEACMKK